MKIGTLGGFTPEEHINARQRVAAIEQLEKLGSVWVGPDVSLKEKVVVPPQERITKGTSIVINKKDLPEIKINNRILGVLDYSMRSFLAQSGIEIKFSNTILSDDMIRNLEKGENITVPVDIINYGQRAVEMEGEVMRFFWVDGQKSLRGKELREAVKSGFVVSGEEGKDWFLVNADWDENFETLRKGNEEGVSILVCLEKQRFYIPFDSEPVKIRNRRELPTVLQEIPEAEGSYINFQIAQTPEIQVGKDMVAVIITESYPGDRTHIASPLVLGGEAVGHKGKVRTEFFNESKHKDTKPSYVEFKLYRK